VSVDFLEVGARQWEEKKGFERMRWYYVVDFWRFYRLVSDREKQYDLVHLNPSFNYGALVRDAVFLRMAKIWKKKTLVFFRGFNLDHVRFVDKYFCKLFIAAYGSTDCFAVLASDFKNRLLSWGFTQPVFVETTLVDDEFVNTFSISDRMRRIAGRRKTNLLFLSRIVKEKGVIETLQAFKLLSERYQSLSLTIAGDGPYLNEAVRFAEETGLQEKISFVGHVDGDSKKEVLTNSDIYIFPSYTEGMPNSVLEAMAFGLPVVVTPVGGLKDIVKNGEHGFLLPENTPGAIAHCVGEILENKDLSEAMSLRCYQSSGRYLASNVVRRLESIYRVLACG
jgi:glycosyltransferase involved in cell wall biosynthesis